MLSNMLVDMCDAFVHFVEGTCALLTNVSRKFSGQFSCLVQLRPIIVEYLSEQRLDLYHKVEAIKYVALYLAG